jgi:hypothetical protein
MTEQVQQPVQSSASSNTPQFLAIGQPIIVDVKKKKKRRYTRGFRDIQKSGRGMTTVSSRLVRAVSKGFDEFRTANNKSSRKRRDGALRDFGINVAKGLGKSLRVSSRAPLGLARALNQRGARRGVRRSIRSMSRIARSWGFR